MRVLKKYQSQTTKQMSSHPSSSTKINKIRKRNPNAHTVEQNLAEALELELLASEAYERSDYLHMAYSNY